MKSLILLICIFSFLPLFAEAGGIFSPRGNRTLNAEENEDLCERLGDSLDRKFVSNPKQLMVELDELIVKQGTLGPDRVQPLKPSGRMLASLSTGDAHKPKEKRRLGSNSRISELDARSHRKLTEANKYITQSKRLGFFDEDEERVTGVQEACARAIYDRAVILDKMMSTK